MKDFDEKYHTLLRSTRSEMSRWMTEINSQFLTQVAVTVDRINGISSVKETSSCVLKSRSNAGVEIQEIIQQAITDLDLYHRDHVYLLSNLIDRYISFNQKYPMSVWNRFNMVLRMDLMNYLMRSDFYLFHQNLFEPQVEEIRIDMKRFGTLVAQTQRSTFVALNGVDDRLERNLIKC